MTCKRCQHSKEMHTLNGTVRECLEITCNCPDYTEVFDATNTDEEPIEEDKETQEPREETQLETPQAEHEILS